MNRFRVEQRQDFDDAAAKDDPVEILFSDQPAPNETSLREPAIAAILVHLNKFRVLLLPTVTEASLTALKCDHADVVSVVDFGAGAFLAT